MTVGLADTTLYVAIESGRPLRLESVPDILRTSIITIGELRAGVLSASDPATRARRLATLTRALALEPIPITDPVAESWARLRVALRDLGSRMAVNDSWIAATALTMGIPVVTQDAGFAVVPGLEIIHI